MFASIAVADHVTNDSGCHCCRCDGVVAVVNWSLGLSGFYPCTWCRSKTPLPIFHWAINNFNKILPNLLLGNLHPLQPSPLIFLLFLYFSVYTFNKTFPLVERKSLKWRSETWVQKWWNLCPKVAKSCARIGFQIWGIEATGRHRIVRCSVSSFRSFARACLTDNKTVHGRRPADLQFDSDGCRQRHYRAITGSVSFCQRQLYEYEWLTFTLSRSPTTSLLGQSPPESCMNRVERKYALRRSSNRTVLETISLDHLQWKWWSCRTKSRPMISIHIDRPLLQWSRNRFRNCSLGLHASQRVKDKGDGYW